MEHRLLVVPALLCAAALVLAGCGKDGGAAKGDAAADVPLGPISQRLADLEKRFDEDTAAAMSTALEEAVAACMKEQGFDYTPQAWDASDVAQAADVPEWGSLEFAKTYGYGITTWQDMPGVEETTETAAPGTETSQVMDEAYSEALWGGGTDEDEPGEAWLPGGCYGEALEAMGTDDLMSSTVLRDINGFASQADRDDRVVAALDGWTTCMADKGYDYQTSDAAQSSIMQRAYSDDGEPLTGDALEALQTEEIATAVADHECGTGLERVRAGVLAELETDYYADHKAEVDAFFVQLEEFLAHH